MAVAAVVAAAEAGAVAAAVVSASRVRILAAGTPALNACELLSKLLVSPLISPIIVPYIIPLITPFKEFRLMVHIRLHCYYSVVQSPGPKMQDTPNLQSPMRYYGNYYIIIGIILGFYRDNGKENGNYRDYRDSYRDYTGVI